MFCIKIILSTVLILGSGYSPIWAQQSMPVTGGDLTGSGGSVSYSIGQVCYIAHAGTHGMVIQGVQQPYEIYTITALEEKRNHTLQFAAFPNPVHDGLMLKAENPENLNLKYQLLDGGGRLLQHGKISGNECVIPMTEYVSGTYILKITVRDEILETCIIIKTNQP